MASVTPIGALPRSKRMPVVGLFAAGMQEYDSGLALMQMHDAEVLYRLDGPTGIRLKLDDMFKAYAVARDIGRDLASNLGGNYYRVTDWMQGHSNFFKAVAMEKTGAAVVAAGNVGCIAQMQGAVTTPVVHPVELLDWATGGPMPLALVGRLDARTRI